jgi:hypothetical protein
MRVATLNSEPRLQPADQPDETLSYTYLQVVGSPYEPM